MARFRLGRRNFVLAGGSAALSAAAQAQTAPPPALIPRRLLFAVPERSRATISPDGKLVAFLGPMDGVQNVWLAPLADPAAARPVTKVTDRDVLNPLVLGLALARHLEDGQLAQHRVELEPGQDGAAEAHERAERRLGVSECLEDVERRRDFEDFADRFRRLLWVYVRDACHLFR